MISTNMSCGCRPSIAATRLQTSYHYAMGGDSALGYAFGSTSLRVTVFVRCAWYAEETTLYAPPVRWLSLVKRREAFSFFVQLNFVPTIGQFFTILVKW
ncbi:hypothetical protein O9929_26225 [Vibrio lentus]|nr:hypothetical protein [Vibrio lentus]